MMVESFDRTKYHPNIAEIIKKTIYNNPYILFKPYPRQLWPIFEVNKPLQNNTPNTVLVGAGGYGGKTYLGSMLAAQYLPLPDYSCLVTRLNYAELTGEDSIWENLTEWCCDENRLGDMACTSNESKLVIRSPTGSKIWFKAFDHVKKKQKVKSESYDRIINDESSELNPEVLSFLYRSLRSSLTSIIPLAMINLSNPGGPATEYLCKEYVDGLKPYYPLDWRHNPYIDKKVYSNTLDNLNPIDRKYQKDGDWHYIPDSGVLKNEWIKYYEPGEVDLSNNTIYTGWDLAISQKETADYTTSCTLSHNHIDNKLYIRDWTREHITFPEQQQAVINRQARWNSTLIGIESVAYQAALKQSLNNKMLPLKDIPRTRDKVTRIASAFTAFEQGQVFLPKNHHLLSNFEQEYALFPKGDHDDLLDATEIVISLARRGGNPFTESKTGYDGTKYQQRLKRRRR